VHLAGSYTYKFTFYEGGETPYIPLLLLLAATFHATLPSEISGFRRKLDENRDLQGYYTASSVNLLPTFRSRNFAKELLLPAA
jgi:hypothetical protein